MNFLSEVLSSAEQAGIENSKKNLPVLATKVSTCKAEINKYIDNVYYQFSEWPKKNQELLDTTMRLSTDIHNLQAQVEDVTVKDIANKTEELDNLSIELEKANIALSIVIHLVQVHELFMNVKELQKQNLYIKAAFELIRVEEHIQSVPEDEVTDAIEALKMTVSTEKSAVVERITEMFENHVRIIQSKSANVQTNSIKITKHSKDFTDILTVLGLFETVTVPLTKFSKFLWKCICKPIMESTTIVKVEDEPDFYVLNVLIKKASLKNSHKDVFSKLVNVFSFVHMHFNYQIDENLKTVAYIGDEIKLALSESLIKNCLSDKLPVGNGDYKAYKQIIEDVKTFHNKLVQLEILSNAGNPILEYTNDMDVICINKKCQEYSSTAIAIMKKDLHDMVEVGVTHSNGDFLTGDEFPESAVSRSTIDLLELVQKLFEEALADTDQAAARLICTAQGIFYQYGSLVHGHHEKLLQTIPQQVVLFRNNCMYLAHQLTMLNEVYSKKFSEAALPIPPVFKDQPHQLRTVGGDTFLGYVEEHIKSMEYTLEQYQFTSSQLSERLHIDTDKCLRQCVRQYELLKTIWHKILPHAVYNKTLGYLLSAFVKKLIDVVLNAQDIPSKNSEQLVEMFKVILTRGPKLFTDPQEVTLYVECWQKLNDLVFILGATLIAIDDRWADGKGPLTLHFTPDELRNLIKALFQTTDRRAALLNKIHN